MPSRTVSLRRSHLRVQGWLTHYPDDLYSEQEKYFDYRSRLHEISIPTLIIVGENDWICPPSELSFSQVDSPVC